MTYSNFKLNAMTKEPCNCGQTHVNFYPDENHYEPACWECYYTYDITDEYYTPEENKFPVQLPPQDEWPF
jgi:hypothetical protein